MRCTKAPAHGESKAARPKVLVVNQPHIPDRSANILGDGPDPLPYLLAGIDVLNQAEVGLVAGTEHFRNVQRHAVVVSPRVLSLRVDESLYFANARFLEDQVAALVALNPAVKHVVLQCTAVNTIDASALESLETIVQRLRDAGVQLHLSEVKGPVMDALQRSDFLGHLSGQVFLTHHQAVTALTPPSVAQGA